jgi:hypothetical protein
VFERGDLVFIDCSQVAKVESHTQHLVTRPPKSAFGRLRTHSSQFWAFECARSWVEEGRAWNELYLVHAFLLFNSTFETVPFDVWFAHHHHHHVMASDLPVRPPT